MSEVLIPGNFVATAEELEKVYGGYRSGDDFRASVIGELEIDSANMSANIKNKNRINEIRRGDTVEGVVRVVNANIVVINIFKVIGKDRVFLGKGDGVLRVAMVSRDYVEDLKDLFQIGDFVRASVMAIEYGDVKLTTKGRDLGVFRAFCKQSRHVMVRDGSQLKCGSCGSVENRKVADNYGNGEGE